MGRFVIEPCVAVKWFVPEDLSSEASRLLDRGHDLMAPDSLPAEVGRLLAGKARKGELSTDECARILGALSVVPIRLEGSAGLLEPGIEVAVALGRPLADGVGIVLAVRLDCRLVTAQRDLLERAGATVFASRLKWIGDLK